VEALAYIISVLAFTRKIAVGAVLDQRSKAVQGCSSHVFASTLSAWGDAYLEDFLVQGMLQEKWRYFFAV